MNTAELLSDAFDRVRHSVHSAIDGIEPNRLTWRPDPEANTIAWLIWHLTRVQDDHVAGVAGHEQVWTSAGWADRFELPFAHRETGYGQSPEAVAAVIADADLLIGYYHAVHAATTRFVGALSDSDLDRVVDDNWDPPVTLGVRLLSVISDDLQHAGQAAYLRGLAERAS
jgi:hypothetical protein